MSKRAVLRLDGTLEQGFHVTLEVGEEGNLHFVEEDGHLPPAPELIQCLEQWRQSYRQLSEPTRIRLEKITVQTGGLTQVGICHQRAKELKGCLKLWLASGSFHIVDNRLREAVSPNDLIRVVLRTQERRLHLLPWHFWDFIERYSKAEIAFNAPALKSSEVKKQSRARKKVRILAILGNSTGINTEADRKLLSDLPDADVSFLVQPSRQQFNEQLWEQQWDILFFAGHSQTEGNAGRIYINSEDSVTIDDLKYGLKRAIAQGLQVAIFNSCDGLGLAYELEQLCLPQMIVMRQPVPDRVAQEFLKQLLTGLANGQRFYLAVRDAREWLQGLEDKFPCASWLPVIFQSPAQPPLTWQDLRCKSERYLQEFRGETTVRRVLPKRTQRKQKLPVVLLVSLVVTLVLIQLRLLGLFQPLELWAYDRFMQLQPASTINEKLLVVAINEYDIQKFKKPLSDQIIAQLLTKLEKYQPRVIGLDIYRDIPQGPQEDWKNLGKQIKNSSIPLIPVCVVGEVEGKFQPLLAIAPPPGIDSKRLGFTDGLMEDPDKIIRRYSLRMAIREESPCSTQYSFSLQLIRYYLSTQPQAELNPGENFQINSNLLKILQPDSGEYEGTKNIMPGSQILINYHPTEQRFKEVSLQDILYGLDSDLISLVQGRIVLIGYVANTKDFHPTPIGKMHGVRIHAQVVSQLLDSIEKQRSLLSYWPQSGDNLWILCWSIMGGILSCFFSSLLRLIIITWLEYLILCTICFSCFIQALWIPLVPSGVGLVVTSILVYYAIQSRIKINLPILNKVE